MTVRIKKQEHEAGILKTIECKLIDRLVSNKFYEELNDEESLHGFYFLNEKGLSS